MSIEKLNFKNFLENKVLLEKKKKKKKKKKSKKSPYGKGGLDDGWFTHGAPNGSSGYDGGAGSGGSSGGSSGGVGESLISEMLAGITPASFSPNMNSVTAFSKNDNDPETGLTTKDPAMTNYPSEEEVEVKANKVDQARRIFQGMINRSEVKRADILNSFMQDTGVTKSTAVSYYTRFLDEFGMNNDDNDDTNLGQGVDMGSDDNSTAGNNQEYGEPISQNDTENDSDEHERKGIIRSVDNAHLIYKKQSENGSYEELWIYNIHDQTNDELDVRRDILAGTDIPQNKTRSPDGVQSYTIQTMGNAQYLHIKNLPN